MAARTFYDRAIRLDRWNAASFFYRGLSYAKDAALGQDKFIYAVRDLERAVRLNPLEPYYHIYFARYLVRFYGSEGIDRFKEATKASLRKDPKDPQLYFLCAKALLSPSLTLRAADEDFAFQLLEKAIRLEERQSYQAYKALWDYKHDMALIHRLASRVDPTLGGVLSFLKKEDLWMHHREPFLRANGISLQAQNAAQRILTSQEVVFGIKDFSSSSDKPVHMGTLMYRSGEIKKEVRIPAQQTVLVVKARSSLVRKSFGTLGIQLDGKWVNALYINSERFREYYTLIETPPGPHTLSFVYMNDFSVDNKDRNVWIEECQFRYS